MEVRKELVQYLLWANWPLVFGEQNANKTGITLKTEDYLDCIISISHAKNIERGFGAFLVNLFKDYHAKEYAKLWSEHYVDRVVRPIKSILDKTLINNYPYPTDGYDDLEKGLIFLRTSLTINDVRDYTKVKEIVLKYEKMMKKFTKVKLSELAELVNSWYSDEEKKEK